MIILISAILIAIICYGFYKWETGKIKFVIPILSQ